MNYPKLSAYMDENGITMKEISRITGRTEGTIKQIFHGKQHFKLSDVVLICKSFGITAEEIFV